MKSSKEFVESIQEQQKKRKKAICAVKAMGIPLRNYRIKNINEALLQKIPALNFRLGFLSLRCTFFLSSSLRFL